MNVKLVDVWRSIVRAARVLIGRVLGKLRNTQFGAIAAADNRDGVGFIGGLPWPMMREDMRFFRKTTLGHVVIMGRNTWNSLPGPLNDRTCIVVSSKPVDGAIWARTVEESIALAGYYTKKPVVWVIGGPKLWIEFFDKRYLSKVLLTRILNVYIADEQWPAFHMYNSANWTVPGEIEKLAYREDGSLLSFVTTYVRSN